LQGNTKSSRNALRHGLLRHNAEGSVGAARLQACCSDEFTELWRNEMDMAHIRAACQDLLAEIVAAPQPKLLKRLRGLSRYERSAFARLRRAVRGSTKRG
jgi:hypothetical protein